jgi:hypothetical protein
MTPVKRGNSPAGYVSSASAIPACHQGSGSTGPPAPTAATIAASISGSCAGINSTSTGRKS